MSNTDRSKSNYWESDGEVLGSRSLNRTFDCDCVLVGDFSIIGESSDLVMMGFGTNPSFNTGLASDFLFDSLFIMGVILSMSILKASFTPELRGVWSGVGSVKPSVPSTEFLANCAPLTPISLEFSLT